MAYKFQTGAAQMDGNLSQEGTLSGSGDLHLATAIDINGSEVLNKDGGGSGFTAANSMTSATALVSVSALNAGSITSGFGAIDNGTSNITTGGKLLIDVDGSAINGAGAITLGAGADAGIYFNGGDLVLDGASGAGLNMSVAGTQVGSWDANGLNLVTDDAFYINSTSVLNATTLGSAVVNSSLTSVGTLSSLGVGAVTSTGVVSSSNDGRFLALDINNNANVIDSSANFSGGNVTAEGTISGSGDLHLATAIDIDASQVLSKTTLGSTVLASSLTSVGNLAGVTSSAGVQFDSTVQLDGVADAVISLSADSLYFLDGDGLMKRDSVSDIVGLMAGTVTTTGLEDASGVLNVSIDGLTAATMATGDLLMFDDGAGGTLRKETIDDMFGLGPALCSAAVFSPGDDFVNFLDDGATGECKKDQWSDIATLVAGSGITATDGVFSVTADSSTPNAMSGGTSASPATMSEGLNYGSTAMLGPAQYWTVPAANLAAGDVIRVKAPSGVTSDNFIRITASVSQNATFDGETSIDLESPYAAVSLFVISADPLVFRII